MFQGRTKRWARPLARLPRQAFWLPFIASRLPLARSAPTKCNLCLFRPSKPCDRTACVCARALAYAILRLLCCHVVAHTKACAPQGRQRSPTPAARWWKQPGGWVFELKARETDRVKLKKAEAKRRGLTAGLGTRSGRWRNIAAVAGQVARTTRRVLGGQGNVAASVSAASAVSAHVKFRAREPRELVAGQRHQPGGPGSGQRSIRRCPSLAQSLARAPDASARAHILTLRTGTRTQVQISAVSSQLSPASLRAVRAASGRMGRS